MTKEQIITALLWSLFGAAISSGVWISQIKKAFENGWEARKEWEEIEQRYYKPEDDDK